MAALGLVSACGPREALYEATLHTQACTGMPALEGVHYLRFRVTGAGMEPVERYVPVERGAAGVPAVPAGKGRVLEVRGYTNLPGEGGRVVALGRSRPFDVPESAETVRPSVNVALRRVDTYARPGSASGGCVSLTEARAGHTATVLEDGRVLLAGGMQSEMGRPTSTLSSAELFDPVTGTLEMAPELGTGEGRDFQTSPRAFHTATRLPGGKVLLAGGQVVSVEGLMTVRSALVLDVARRTYTGVELTAARSHHAAAADSGGRVLLVGGMDVAGRAVSEAEGFDPATGQVFSVSTPVSRMGMGVMPVRDGRSIAVVGGSDGRTLSPEVLFFSYEGGTFVPSGETGRLREPRRDAALVPFGGAERLLYVGGHASADGLENGRILASSEVVSGSDVTAGPQVFARSGICAVALPDGRVMTIGGRRSTSSGLLSDSHVEMLVPGKNGAAPGLLGLKPLERQRHQHTCTVLEDGSVLIAGGVDDSGNGWTTLGDLVIYTPVPLD
ncbi:kelch repeat-containing protein [Archangium lipolyticum]|uniref:kelch repeat-containing protein n=1 Tax=Archangium lipolyticum TaxID=2970465 RepID=UPI002149AD66|nr:kelch repeat-containing protein [Archangium lipolyticum]